VFIVSRAANPEFVKVLGFGVAKLRGGPHATQDTLTATGMNVGTAPYMAPEQWQARTDIDGRADIYSLGVYLLGREPARPLGTGHPATHPRRQVAPLGRCAGWWGTDQRVKFLSRDEPICAQWDSYCDNFPCSHESTYFRLSGSRLSGSRLSGFRSSGRRSSGSSWASS